MFTEKEIEFIRGNFREKLQSKLEKIKNNKPFDEHITTEEYNKLTYFIFNDRDFEAIIKYDLRRLNEFKSKFDLDKYSKRLLGLTLAHEFLDDLFLYFFDEMMKIFVKKIKIPVSEPKTEIDKQFIKELNLPNNLYVLNLYITLKSIYMDSTKVFKKYDRFNYDYNVDLDYFIELIIEEISIFFKDTFVIFLFPIKSFNSAYNKAKKLFGNPIEDRKSGNYEKYMLAIQYIKTFDTYFPKIRTGIQKMSCELANIESNFVKWKSQNRKKYSEIYDNTSVEDMKLLKIKINNYLKTYLSL